MKKPVIFLVGPTAVGKSKIAIKLARKIKAEIISCDSMQVYKGMDIGTSKVSRAQRIFIKHHLIDVVRPNEEFNVSIFKEKVELLIEDIHKKDKIPLLVGGSGLYMKIILDGIFKEDGDESIRERLKMEAEEKGSEVLYKRLKELDPETAAILHPKDSRRIVRALEVYYKLGMPISEAKKRTEGIYKKYNVFIFCLMREKDELYSSIDKRVDLMFKKGILKEARRLIKRYNLSKTAKNALGYKEIFGYFKGEYNLNEAKRLIKRNTRHYAKRQITWFKKDPRIEWLKVSDKDKEIDLINNIIRKINASS